ncbi:MAG TPA: ATP-binding protein [Gemmatimonadales bacterium]|jgi:PAS domain S-box-containing protein
MSLPLVDGKAAELLRALTQVSRAVSNAASLEPIMQLAAEQAAALVGAERSVVLLTEMDGRLRVRASHGLESSRLRAFSGPLDESLIAQLAPVLGETSPERVLAVPLVVRGQVTGLIATVPSRDLGNSNHAEVVLTALADQMAAPIEHARMAEEVRQAQLLAENVRLHQAERAARESAEGGRDILRAVMEYIPEGITIADAPDATITLMSRFGLELLGRSWEEVRGLSAEQQARLLPMCRPGRSSPADAAELPLTRAVREGTVVRSEEWMLLGAGGSQVPLLCEAGPIRDKDGKITGGIMAWREIAAHKRMQQQLAQSQRLQAVGKLTGGVAHEVNNMMTVVIGFGRYVLEQLAPAHPRRGDVEQMVRAAARAADMTRQLLAFSRQQMLQPMVVQLEPLVENMAPLLRQLLGADKTLELGLSEQPLHVFADPGQLEQVLINLVANARDAMEARGRVTISTAEKSLDSTWAQAHPEVTLVPGQYAALMISDTGKGMDPVTQASAFEPFYTTKGVGEGTGLGLATVYGIVKQSDGYIWIYSELGIGTTVKIYLPLSQQQERRPSGPVQPPAEGGRETILVVEDEPLVRYLARDILQRLGYGVLEAESGEAALATMRGATLPVDLVLSDVVMPGLSAKALADELARIRPAVPVLYMSAYPGDDVVRRGLLEAGDPFIQKPFVREELAWRVRELLDRVNPAG